jgi:hypothetical protein
MSIKEYLNERFEITEESDDKFSHKERDNMDTIPFRLPQKMGLWIGLDKSQMIWDKEQPITFGTVEKIASLLNGKLKDKLEKTDRFFITYTPYTSLGEKIFLQDIAKYNKRCLAIANSIGYKIKKIYRAEHNGEYWGELTAVELTKK